MGLNLNDAVSSFLKKEDFSSPKLMTIEAIGMELVGEEHKTVVKFRESTRKMVLNKTNTVELMEMYPECGADADNFIGKQVVVYEDPDIVFGGKKVGGIRVRKPKAGAAQTKPEPVAEDDIPF